MENVKIIKLVTGEEVLSEVKDLPDGVVLIKPMMLVMQQQGLQMVPWLMLAKEQKIKILKDKIVMQYEAKAELVSAYQQQVTGIVTAPANAIDGKGKLVL